MRICIASSTKFYKDWEAIKKSLEAEGHEVFLPNDVNSEDGSRIPEANLNLETKKKYVLDFFNLIDESDILYILAKEGYVGHSVCAEAGYAFAKGKRVISSEEIGEDGIAAFVRRVLTVENLIKYLKNIRREDDL